MLFGSDEEDPATTALEFQPEEREPLVGPAHGCLGIADLDDEQPARAQIRVRLPQDHPHGIEALAHGRKREWRLVTILERKS